MPLSVHSAEAQVKRLAARAARRAGAGTIGSKSWKAAYASDARLAKMVASRQLNRPYVASTLRFMAAGAAIGGSYGGFKSLMGDENSSMLGGALRGAVVGAGLRGVGALGSLMKKPGAYTQRQFPFMGGALKGRATTMTQVPMSAKIKAQMRRMRPNWGNKNKQGTFNF